MFDLNCLEGNAEWLAYIRSFWGELLFLLLFWCGSNYSSRLPFFHPGACAALVGSNLWDGRLKRNWMDIGSSKIKFKDRHPIDSKS